MTADDPRGTATHEAAHFVADLLLAGRVPAIVSTRPGKDHSGVVIHAERVRVDYNGHYRDQPLIGQDPAFRASVEATIVALLAGQAAEALAVRLTGWQPDPTPDEAAARMARSLAEQSPRDLELLREAEEHSRARDESFVGSDDEQAFELSLRLVDREATAHVAWLQAVAERFVQRNADLILALADELLRRPILSGEHAASIVRRAAGLTEERTA